MDSGPTFVTGGSGVVGSAVIRRLVAEAREVRALARSDAAAEKVGDLGAEPVRGDVLDVESLTRAMDGAAVAYHVAGVNQFCLRDPEPMDRVNITGSTNCVIAAHRTGVCRLVYTSSAVALGEARGTVGREDSHHRGTFISDYERSKFRAERAVLGLAERLGVDVVSVNPSSVQGPGRATGSGQVLVHYLRGRLKFWVDTVISFVDVDDCAEGHVLAERKGVAGHRYVLNGASLDSTELVAVMRAVAPGIDRPRLVPPVLAEAVVAAVMGAARVRRRPPLVCRESLRALLHGHRYDGSRASRELGLQYRPAGETLRRTAAWLAEAGLVPSSALNPSNREDELFNRGRIAQ